MLILYSTLVNSELTKNLEEIFAKFGVDAKQWGYRVFNPKACGDQRRNLGGGCDFFLISGISWMHYKGKI